MHASGRRVPTFAHDLFARFELTLELQMAKGDGWSFYVDEGGKIRNFMIGEQKQTTAQLSLQSQSHRPEAWLSRV
jgi:hypothetical protein